MIDALIHFVLNTAFVVVFAPIATIVFLIAWPFLHIRRRLAVRDAQRLRLTSLINAMPAARSVEGNIYRTETIFSRRKFAGSKSSLFAWVQPRMKKPREPGESVGQSF